MINLDDKKKNEYIGFHRNTAVCLDSFGIEYIPQNELNKIKDKSITHIIFRVQDDDPIKCGFYCITYIEYMLTGKTLLYYTNSSSLKICSLQ